MGTIHPGVNGNLDRYAMRKRREAKQRIAELKLDSHTLKPKQLAPPLIPMEDAPEAVDAALRLLWNDETYTPRATLDDFGEKFTHPIEAWVAALTQEVARLRRLVEQLQKREK